jgi:hypothetical protein
MCAPSAAEASLFKDKIEQGWVNSCAVIKVRSFCCTRGTHRVTVQRQDWTRLSELMKLLTFITAHEFTQPCSILTLNSDTLGAPNAAETSYLYHSTWVHSALFNLVFEQWHDVACALIKVRSFCCTRGTHRVTVQRQDWTRLSELMCYMSSHSLVQSCLWTMTRCVPLVQQKLFTFIRVHEFTQP